jgi:hypothetical protein
MKKEESGYMKVKFTYEKGNINIKQGKIKARYWE